MKVSFQMTLALMLLCASTVWAGGTIAYRQPESIPSGKVLALSDCIALALNNQASIRQSAAQVDVQMGGVNQAKSKLLPGVAVTSTTYIADDTQKRGAQIDASLDQLVYDFGRSKSQLNEAQRQSLASQAALAGTQADVTLNVKQAYYTLLLANHLVDVYAETLKAQEEHVAQSQARKNAGVAPQADVLKAQAAAASARVDLVKARNNADQAGVALNTAMGVNIQNPITVSETSEPLPPVLDQQELVNIALSRRPEVRQSTELALANEALVKVAKTGNLPSISTSIGRTQGISQGSSDQANSLTWMMNVTWSAYDSGNTAGAVKSARAQLVSAQEALYDIRQTVTQNVVQSRLNAIAADEQLTLSEVEVASAKENLAVAEGRYEAGIGILLDVLDAQSALQKAEGDELTARYGLSTARAVLEHAIGENITGGVKH